MKKSIFLLLLITISTVINAQSSIQYRSINLNQKATEFTMNNINGLSCPWIKVSMESSFYKLTVPTCCFINYLGANSINNGYFDIHYAAGILRLTFSSETARY